MIDIRKRLVETIAAKDQVTEMLTNLEKLRIGNGIEEDLYITKKEEYLYKFNSASLEINKTKDILKVHRETALMNLSTCSRDLERLEVEYKVGEMTPAKYQASKKKLAERINTLNTDCADIERLIAANSLADIHVKNAQKHVKTNIHGIGGTTEIMLDNFKHAITQQAIIHRGLKFTGNIPLYTKQLSDMIKTKTAQIQQREIRSDNNIQTQLPTLQTGTAMSARTGLRIFNAANIASPLGIICIVIGVGWLLCIFLLPWFSFYDVQMSLILMNWGIGLSCFILTGLYIAAEFVSNRLIRGLGQMIAAIIALVLWLVFRFAVMPEIARFTGSVYEMTSTGFWLFLVTVIAGFITGILQLFRFHS